MGVMGWTYDQVLDTPMPAIVAALGARRKFIGEILKAVFGSPDEPEPIKEKVTPKLFRQLFGGGK